ncbi:AAA family ATPase [Desulfoferrobacter suflitae]|uniref:AAA family ATPase n=1 Tax=Desulfoferrobacter suflitae TaxID=2865782 RepID=UPI002164E223|nr:AAA family ATPase [Desulfoferrobacter suflitae]MCK8602934.1 hypothetical protein [Desulfoferrobacter suflitae]
MKIVGVEFKNINSFAGEWEVRFDRPPFSDTGLYAIVGRNGSGKSSILDAITLGLYGETPRHRNPEERIVPQQADESSAAVTFAVGDNRYRSEWRVKSFEGRLQGPEMRLWELNGKESLLENRVIRVRSRVADLTGLDFKRFCRSVLLAQGEFAAFLTALESERSEILEKIIGPEMKLELEHSIRSNLAAEAEKLQQLKEAAAGLSLLDRSRLDQIEQEQEQLEDEIKGVEEALRELQEQEHWLQQLQQLQDTERDAARALLEAKARQAELAEMLQLIEDAQSAKPLAEALERLDGRVAALEEMKNQTGRLKEDLAGRERSLVELEEQLQRSLSGLEEARRRLDERGAEWSGAALQDREIEVKSQQFQDAVRELEARERGRKQKEQRRTQVDGELVALHKELRDLERRLERLDAEENLLAEMPAIQRGLDRLMTIQRQIRDEQGPRAQLLKAEEAAARALQGHEQKVLKLREQANRLANRRAEGLQRLTKLLDDHSPDHWVKLIKTSRKSLSVCRELAKIGTEYRKQQVNGDALERLQRVASQMETVRLSLAEEQAQLDELAEQIRWRDRVRSLDAQRSELQERAACPLCGSLVHPFMQQGTPDFGELDRSVQAHEKKIAALSSQLDSLEATAAGLQGRANEMTRLRQLWARTCEKAGVDWETPDARLAAAESRAQKALIRDAKGRIRSCRWQKWKNAWLQRALLRKEAKLGRGEAEHEKARERHRLEQQALAAMDSRIERLQQEDNSIRSELGARLATYGERPPAPGDESSLLQRLEARSQDYRRVHEEHKSRTQRLESLENEKLDLSVSVQQLQQNTAVLAEEIEELQVSLTRLKADRAAQFGTLDPAGERAAVESRITAGLKEQSQLQQEIGSRQKQLGEAQAALTQLHEREQLLREDLEKARPELETRANQAGFASLEQVRQSLALLREEQEVIARHQAGRQALAEAEAREAAARHQLQMLRAERKTEESITVVQQRLTDYVKHRDALQDRKSDLDRLLLEQRTAEGEYRDIRKAIALQEKVWAEAVAEQGMLESPDDPQMRTRLQRLMLDRLLEHSNQYLGTLSDRYRLMADDQEGLGFLVRDTLQTRTYRPVETLSGGETFIVSLCLALGLSEMACQHRKIESLLIDEGFGTLDEENLYRAITLLKGLRDNGKMVGIISHVKRLAGEIPTQIRVEKQPSGMSRLTITA